MTIVTVGSVNTLSLTGASAGAVAGATVGTGVGLAGRLLNAGPAASLGGALGAGISAGSILGASVTAIKGSYLQWSGIPKPVGELNIDNILYTYIRRSRVYGGGCGGGRHQRGLEQRPGQPAPRGNGGRTPGLDCPGI